MSAELSITIFGMFLSALFFAIPKLMNEKSEDTIPSIALTVGSNILGWMAVMSVAAMVMEISNEAGYYSGIFSTYISMIFIIVSILIFYMVLKSIFTSIKMIKLKRMKKRGLV